MMKFRKQRWLLTGLALFLSVSLTSCGEAGKDFAREYLPESTVSVSAVEEVPEYTGEPYVEINDGQPDFTEEELTAEAYEDYGELDGLGRCQTVEACVGQETMPDEERGQIGQIKPTGWHTVKYAGVDGNYLYNRCHLIGYQLTAENANPQNLITGTRYMNTEGMLPFENMVADYVKETGNHVMYRVTPIFEGDNLVASGVQMEAESVEDEGEGICYNVYVYNVQPDIEIDYATGESQEAEDADGQTDAGKTAESAETGQGGESREVTGVGQKNESAEEQTYILNKNSKKFHRADCSGVADMKAKNKKEYTGTREDLIEEGYEPCARCKP